MKHLEDISAKVNNQFEFTNEDIDQLDFTPIDDRNFHILANGKSYRAELVSRNFQRKRFTIKINGSKYEINLADAYDQMVERLGLGAINTTVVSDIMAPMPGLVLQVMAKEGEQVTAGQPILILEAMKMENVIKAAADGVIAKISVSKGAAVEKGQLLVKMED
jgi:biotin carboxyl carrier protein